ncbi:sensor histidine kinase [Dyadobacter sp. CY261]|uniref:sensor histidine kinase n=1 Tax=Dyadobacter sp. CY261 TaxID=2907203 RepID=UPI001F17BA2C|nr:sensor histidine kinase [Dyadobacter sp. CY261]MCF0074373.1 sensor histidine kinase [Dyadobacter sp. CY261]
MLTKEEVLNALSRRKDTCLLLGTFCWIAIAYTIGSERPWEAYYRTLVMCACAWVPALVLVWVREGSGQGRFEGINRRYWLLFFAGYWPVLMLLSAAQIDATHLLWTKLFVAGICIALLECALVLDAHYFHRLRSVTWMQRLTLEKAVLVSISGLAVLLGAMAVSSLNNPAYHSDKQLLIGFELHFLKILSMFPTFVSFSLQLLTMYLAGYFFFYVNSKWLVPRILKERGMLAYLLCGAALIGIFYPFCGQLLANLPLSQLLGGVFSANPFVAENAFGAVMVVLISLPVLLAIQWSRQNSLITALQHEKSLAELDLLKQQLNPHFFFNTLNNLYALSLQRSEQTPESILQLSELMRYVIYKAKEPLVSIREEVRYLEDYLQLQQIRLKRKLDLRFEKVIGAENASIAPLLLIVFVENAFKHGIEPAEEAAFLYIALKADADKLHFFCRNSFETSRETHSGIGLTNLQKRLALLYPGKHLLKTASENGTFTAELEIDLL